MTEDIERSEQQDIYSLEAIEKKLEEEFQETKQHHDLDESAEKAHIVRKEHNLADISPLSQEHQISLPDPRELSTKAEKDAWYVEAGSALIAQNIRADKYNSQYSNVLNSAYTDPFMVNEHYSKAANKFLDCLYTEDRYAVFDKVCKGIFGEEELRSSGVFASEAQKQYNQAPSFLHHGIADDFVPEDVMTKAMKSVKATKALSVGAITGSNFWIINFIVETAMNILAEDILTKYGVMHSVPERTGEVEVVQPHGASLASWYNETTAPSDSSLQPTNISIDTQGMTWAAAVTDRMLQYSTFDVMSYLDMGAARAFRDTFNNTLVNGSGTAPQPRGLANLTIPSAQTLTVAGTSTITPAEFVRFFNSIPQVSNGDGKFIFASNAIKGMFDGALTTANGLTFPMSTRGGVPEFTLNSMGGFPYHDSSVLPPPLTGNSVAYLCNIRQAFYGVQPIRRNGVYTDVVDRISQYPQTRIFFRMQKSFGIVDQSSIVKLNMA